VLLLYYTGPFGFETFSEFERSKEMSIELRKLEIEQRFDRRCMSALSKSDLAKYPEIFLPTGSSLWSSI
jgi:hypothetical protein